MLEEGRAQRKKKNIVRFLLTSEILKIMKFGSLPRCLLDNQREKERNNAVARGRLQHRLFNFCKNKC